MATGYRMRAKAAAGGGKIGEILIYTDIGGGGWFSEGLTAKQFANDLKAMGKLDTLQVRINSAGGDVFDGLAIYNTLRRHEARKEVSIDGMALSIASVIAMAGDKISMAENAMMMIHDPWSIAMGTATDFREQADLLDQIKENTIVTYMRKAKGSEQHVRDMMSAETWFRAADAVEEGFADEMTPDLAIAARFDPNRFKNVPPSIRAAVQRNQAAASPHSDLARARVQQLKQRVTQMK